MKRWLWLGLKILGAIVAVLVAVIVALIIIVRPSKPMPVRARA